MPLLYRMSVVNTMDVTIMYEHFGEYYFKGRFFEINSSNIRSYDIIDRYWPVKSTGNFLSY